MAEANRIPPATSLLDDLSRILGKGMTVEGPIKNTLLGIELYIIDKKEACMSVDRYIKYAKWIRRARLFESSKKTKE